MRYGVRNGCRQTARLVEWRQVVPALIFTGVPPIMANATSALAVSPGYLGSTLGFRPELRSIPLARLKREMVISAAGGVAGALLLLVT